MSDAISNLTDIQADTISIWDPVLRQFVDITQYEGAKVLRVFPEFQVLAARLSLRAPLGLLGQMEPKAPKGCLAPQVRLGVLVRMAL